MIYAPRYLACDEEDRVVDLNWFAVAKLFYDYYRNNDYLPELDLSSVESYELPQVSPRFAACCSFNEEGGLNLVVTYQREAGRLDEIR